MGRWNHVLARRDTQHFDCTTWLHKALVMPEEEFKRKSRGN